jgi:hypothetical protein
MRRIISLVVVALVMGAMMLAMAMPAIAAESNFGHCASENARSVEPGPGHGQSQSLASVFNPHGEDLQCTKDTDNG